MISFDKNKMRIITFVMNLLWLPKIDIYTGLHLSRSRFSKEHIIPQRFFPHKKDADDLLNLAPADRFINSMRCDLRFGYQKEEHIPYPFYIDRKKRTFFPSILADKGLISRSIIEMLHKYPYLYCYLNDIVDNTDTLWKWSNENPEPSTFEKARNEYLKK